MCQEVLQTAGNIFFMDVMQLSIKKYLNLQWHRQNDSPSMSRYNNYDSNNTETAVCTIGGIALYTQLTVHTLHKKCLTGKP